MHWRPRLACICLRLSPLNTTAAQSSLKVLLLPLQPLLVRIQGVAEVLGRSGGGKRHPLAVESLHALGVRLEVEPAVDVIWGPLPEGVV